MYVNRPLQAINRSNTVQPKSIVVCDISAAMGSCRVLILLAITLSLSLSASSFQHEAVSYANLATDDAALLEVFQVYPPPISHANSRGSTVCSYTLMNHVFSNSAGKPYVGKYDFSNCSHLGTYRPLCGNDWDIAVLNLSVISYGRQFDRLGVLFASIRLMIECLDREYRGMEDLYC